MHVTVVVVCSRVFRIIVVNVLKTYMHTYTHMDEKKREKEEEEEEEEVVEVGKNGW